MASTGSIFNFSGIGSGFSTDTILQKMLDVVKAPIQGYQTRQASITQEQSAWRNINTRVLGLGTAADALKSDDVYQSRQAASSDATILTATAGAGQAHGNYTLSVESLAQNHQQISQAYAASDSVLGTGSITVKVGSGTFNPITIDSSNNTLSGIRDAINKAGVGVAASIIDAGEAAGSSRYRLSLSSNTSGSSGQIDATFSLSGTSTPVMSDLVAAQDAHVKLGTGASALDIYSSSNTITNALDGVSLNLVSASPGKTINVNVTQNTAPARQAVQNFLDQYNALSDVFKSNNSYDSTTQTSGVLFGDSTMQSLQGDIISKVTASRDVGGGLNSLTSMGITLDDKGKLSITDTAAFEKALANPTDMKKLFTDSNNGIATNMRSFVDQQTSVVNGTIFLEDKRLTDQFDDLTASIARVNDSASRTETRLREVFLNLETALSSIKSQSTAISAQLGSLSSNSSSSSKSSN